MRRLWLAVTVTALMTVTGCSSSAPAPASQLNGSSALTCSAGSRGCTAPGRVRWSVPLPGSASFDISTGESLVNMPAMAAEGITSFGDIPAGYLANVAVAPGVFLFQQPNRPVIEAIEPATGRRLWTTKLPTPRNFSPDNDVSGALSITFAVSGGLVTAYDQTDYLWWLLNAATGSVTPPRRLAAYSQPGIGGQAPVDVLPVTSRSVILLNYTSVQDVDPVTGSVRWQVPVKAWTGDAAIGDTLYLDNDPYSYNFDTKPNRSPTGTDTAIQRVDVGSGRLLPQLPIAADLQAEDGKVVQFAEDPGALLVAAGGAFARVSPATGRAIWVYRMPARAQGGAQPGPTGVPPTVEFLESGQVNGTQDPPPSPGTGTNIWRVLVVSLTTGQATPTDLGRSLPYSDAGIDTADVGGDNWNLYGSVMLAAPSTSPRPAGAGGFSYTRLEGVGPATGRVLWRAPVAADLYVLGETFSGPPLIIAESCAPSGLSPDQSTTRSNEAFCDSERLYAING